MNNPIRFFVAFVLVLGLGVALAQEDTFVYQPFAAVDSLDPAQGYDTASTTVLENIYETLVGYDRDSITDFVGLLATDWEIDEGGTTYTYTLREGVTFHSGNAFSCADVEYTFKRLLVHNPSDSGVWFIAESFLPTQSNADLYLGEEASDEEYAEYWSWIDNSVECLDESTVQFNLRDSDPTFFVKIMHTVGAIVDRDWSIENGLWDGREDTWREWVGINLREFYLHTNPSGTGAYRLVDWDGGTTVVERFDDYWGEAPYFRNVVVDVVEETSTRILSLQAGDADHIELDRGQLEQVRGAPGVTIHEEPEWVSTVVGMLFFNHNINLEDNPDVGSGELDGRGIPANFFEDVDLRKCFAYSFDQQAFIEQVLDGEGQALTMVLPPSFLGYNEDLPIYTLDPERAEEHCRRAHGGAVWEQGFELTATYNAGNEVRQAALEIVKDNIEFLNPNFRMNIRSLSWPEYLSHTGESKGTMFALGWAPSYADSDYFIHPFYHSEGFASGRTGMADEEVDALIDEARVTVDEDAREALYRRVGELAYDWLPLLPYPSSTEFIVTRSDVAGVYWNPMYQSGGGFLWKDISRSE